MLKDTVIQDIIQFLECCEGMDYVLRLFDLLFSVLPLLKQFYTLGNYLITCTCTNNLWF